MASAVTTSRLPAVVNGDTSHPADDAAYQELVESLLRLRDVVLAGKHSIKLPPDAIERLKNTSHARSTLASGEYTQNASATTYNEWLAKDQHASASHESEMLRAERESRARPPPTQNPEIDPIFLQKSSFLVRAEFKLRRERIERDLRTDLELRKASSKNRDFDADRPASDRNRELDADAPENRIVSTVLADAQRIVKPVLLLTEEAARLSPAASSSFDENDYYSSQVQSEWSSDEDSSERSDKAAGAFTAEFERLDGDMADRHHIARPDEHRQKRKRGKEARYEDYGSASEPGEVYKGQDDDDDYTPPDATMSENSAPMELQEDDNSDYEPGEITEENIVPRLQAPPQQAVQPNPRVIRNHLTNIAAPQPNRVSPLATAKGPLELQLVNGRPEVVQRSLQHEPRDSSASPLGHGAANKKRRVKKRKRDVEPLGRAKRRQRVAPGDGQDMYIKNEPVSPAPFATTAAAYRPGNAAAYPQYQSENHSVLSYQSNAHPPHNAQPGPPAAASPRHRPIQRDTEDLRRVASLHVAQPAPYAQHQRHSPAPAPRTMSMTYGEPPRAHGAPIPDWRVQPIPTPGYREASNSGVQPGVGETLRRVRDERSRSPPRAQLQVAPYAARTPLPVDAAPHPHSLPVVPRAGREYIRDQLGRLWEEATPSPPPAAATLAPAPQQERPVPGYDGWERAPSRTTYAPPPAPPTRYDAGPSLQPQPYSVEYQPSYRGMTAPPPAAGLSLGQPAHFDYPQMNTDQYGRVFQEPTSPQYNQPPLPYSYQPPSRASVAPPSFAQPPQASMAPPPRPMTSAANPPYQQPLRASVPPPTRAMECGDLQPQRASAAPPPARAMEYGDLHPQRASVAPPSYAYQQPGGMLAPPPPRAASTMLPQAYPGTPAGAYVFPYAGQQYAAPAPVQALRYVDEHGNEVFPREVRTVNGPPPY